MVCFSCSISSFCFSTFMAYFTSLCSINSFTFYFFQPFPSQHPFKNTPKPFPLTIYLDSKSFDIPLPIFPHRSFVPRTLRWHPKFGRLSKLSFGLFQGLLGFFSETLHRLASSVPPALCKIIQSPLVMCLKNYGLPPSSPDGIQWP
jgi:hypothetical protein